MSPFKCPKRHGPMPARKIKKQMTFKGVDLVVEVDAFVCDTCGFEAGTIESAGAVQRAIAEAFRCKTGRSASDGAKRLRQPKIP